MRFLAHRLFLSPSLPARSRPRLSTARRGARRGARRDAAGPPRAAARSARRRRRRPGAPPFVSSASTPIVRWLVRCLIAKARPIRAAAGSASHRAHVGDRPDDAQVVEVRTYGYARRSRRPSAAPSRRAAAAARGVYSRGGRASPHGLAADLVHTAGPCGPTPDEPGARHRLHRGLRISRAARSPPFGRAVRRKVRVMANSPEAMADHILGDVDGNELLAL